MEKAGFRCLNMQLTEKVIKDGMMGAVHGISSIQANLLCQRNQEDDHKCKLYAAEVERQRQMSKKETRQKEKTLVCHTLTTDVNPFKHLDDYNLPRILTDDHLVRRKDFPDHLGRSIIKKKKTFRKDDKLDDDDATEKNATKEGVNLPLIIGNYEKSGENKEIRSGSSDQTEGTEVVLTTTSNYKVPNKVKLSIVSEPSTSKAHPNASKTDTRVCNALPPLKHKSCLVTTFPVSKRKEMTVVPEESRFNPEPRIGQTQLYNAPRKIMEDLFISLPAHLQKTAKKRKQEARGPDFHKIRKQKLLERSKRRLMNDVLADSRWTQFIHELGKKPQHNVKSKYTSTRVKSPSQQLHEQNLSLCFESLRWVPM